MPLPEQCIQEFRQLWKQTTGEDLDFEAAQKQAEAILTVANCALLNGGRDPPNWNMNSFFNQSKIMIYEITSLENLKKKEYFLKIEKYNLRVSADKSNRHEVEIFGLNFLDKPGDVSLTFEIPNTKKPQSHTAFFVAALAGVPEHEIECTGFGDLERTFLIGKELRMIVLSDQKPQEDIWNPKIYDVCFLPSIKK